MFTDGKIKEFLSRLDEINIGHNSMDDHLMQAAAYVSILKAYKDQEDAKNIDWDEKENKA